MGKGRLRLGVIGMGSMGSQHARNVFNFAARAELSGVQDPDRARAEALALSCGSPRIFASPGDLIACPDIDAVLVAAPDAFHAELVLACIKAGKPVLCEKPLASEPAEALRVLEAEASLERPLVSMGFQRRFDPFHLAVKAAVASGSLGLPLLWKGVHRNARPAYNSSGAFILMNTAGHDFDSARWLLGEEILEVEARGLRSRPDLPVDSLDLLLVLMLLSHGRLASAEIFVGADYGYEVEAELVCQRGTARTAQPEGALVRKDGQRGSPVAPDWTAPFQAAYVAELQAWVDSVLGQTGFPGASAWDAYVAMLASATSALSLKEGRSLKLELPPKPALYTLQAPRLG